MNLNLANFYFLLDIISLCDKAVDFKECVKEVLVKLVETDQGSEEQSALQSFVSENNIEKRFSSGNHNGHRQNLVNRYKHRRMKVKY